MGAVYLTNNNNWGKQQTLFSQTKTSLETLQSEELDSLISETTKLGGQTRTMLRANPKSADGVSALEHLLERLVGIRSAKDLGKSSEAVLNAKSELASVRNLASDTNDDESKLGLLF